MKLTKLPPAPGWREAPSDARVGPFLTRAPLRSSPVFDARVVRRVTMASALGRIAGACIGLWVIGADGAEVSRLVKARVQIGVGFERFRHEVSIANTDTTRSVMSVLLWQNAGLPEEPKDLIAPAGWDVHALRRERAGGISWAIQFECRPVSETERDVESTSVSGVDDAPCGIHAGQTMKFTVVLLYRAESFQTEQVLVGFSDGRVGISS
jgi:hypothetical protein